MENSEPESQGLHRDLEPLLIEQIQAQPEGSKPRLRLLELYFSDRKQEAFLREARAFSQACRRTDNPQAWDSVVAMGQRLLPDEQLFLTMSEGIEFDLGSAEQPADDIYQRIGENPIYAAYFERLTERYAKLQDHAGFMKALETELREISPRPTPMMHVRALSRQLGGARVYIKREDLAAKYSQLTISVLGQAMIARQLGYERLVTSSISGFRAVLTASIARRLGMKALVFVDGRTSTEQPGNLKRLWLMGAEVETVKTEPAGGRRGIREATVDWDGGDIREIALEYCVQNPDKAFMVTGLDALPEPYPSMQMEFQAVIGRECMRQVFAEMKRLPDLMVARAGDNPDAIGFFAPFLRRKQTRLACVPVIESLSEQAETHEETRELSMELPQHVRRTEGRLRAMSRALEGMEYPSVVREQQWLKATGRVEYPEVSKEDVRKAIQAFSDLEGYIPGISTAHALAFACEQAAKMAQDQAVVVITSERTELGIEQVAELAGV